MKRKIITTPDYLLAVEDSVINLDDWVYTETGVLFQYGAEHKRLPGYLKVLACLSLGMSSDLEGVPVLPSLPDDDDVEKLAEESANSFKYLNFYGYVGGFMQGYNRTRKKYIAEIDKQISDFRHDLRESTSIHVKQNCEGAIFGLMRLKESLSQPKIPTHFEFEMIPVPVNHASGLELTGHQLMDAAIVQNYCIKTVVDLGGQDVACGQYLYGA